MTLPNMVGESQATAAAQIAALGLRNGTFWYGCGSGGTVISQSPPAGSIITNNSGVQVTLVIGDCQPYTYPTTTTGRVASDYPRILISERSL